MPIDPLYSTRGKPEYRRISAQDEDAFCEAKNSYEYKSLLSPCNPLSLISDRSVSSNSSSSSIFSLDSRDVNLSPLLTRPISLPILRLGNKCGLRGSQAWNDHYRPRVQPLSQRRNTNVYHLRLSKLSADDTEKLDPVENNTLDSHESPNWIYNRWLSPLKDVRRS